MVESPDNPPPRDEQLDAWLEQLAGRATGPPADATAWQARLIRKVVLARQKRAEEAITDEDIRRGREKLQFRLARERLLTGGAGSRWLTQSPLAIAATVAIVAMGAFITFETLRQVPPAPGAQILWSVGELDALRGEEITPQTVVTPTPDADARALAGQLAAASIPFELSGVPDEPQRLLKIQVAGQVFPDEVTAALARIGVETRDEDVVYVEFANSVRDR
jgi:hypothetical protein